MVDTEEKQNKRKVLGQCWIDIGHFDFG